uniref:ATPTB4 n=1 Tax=Euglena gracilis TaxID=3039 RepID=UPI0012B67DE1|nr:Chain C, ATPTB4 [Euglena gracilis]6TDU_c Chain c, ATPTB4 [Euglena gracilis]6TDW_C Chain C, ATPTB4 [Euglena gracilis]6TDY_c Chain c, ATPTB4 [Euglena gracilis]6TDZ_c Chain c, subunit c [Euglena gracilis]
MFRGFRPVLAADAVKFQTLYNVLTGKQHLKDQVPVKDCNLTAIFGASWKADLNKWFDSEYAPKLPAAERDSAKKSLDLYLKRVDLTRYTREELTTYGILACGPGKVDALTEKHLLETGKARLEELTAGLGNKDEGVNAFRKEVEQEGKYANWPAEKSKALADKVIAASP